MAALGEFQRQQFESCLARARPPTFVPPHGYTNVTLGGSFADTLRTVIHRWRGEPEKLPGDAGE